MKPLNTFWRTDIGHGYCIILGTQIIAITQSCLNGKHHSIAIIATKRQKIWYFQLLGPRPSGPKSEETGQYICTFTCLGKSAPLRMLSVIFRHFWRLLQWMMWVFLGEMAVFIQIDNMWADKAAWIQSPRLTEPCFTNFLLTAFHS
jgi:hypothetical protein